MRRLLLGMIRRLGRRLEMAAPKDYTLHAAELVQAAAAEATQTAES